MEKLPVPATSASQEERQRGNLITAIGNKVRGIKAYRQAKQEMRDAWEEVHRAVSEQAFDKEGNQLPSIAYGAGLHLRSPLTEAEQEQFLQEYHQNVMERWPEAELELKHSGSDPFDRQLSRMPGRMSDGVHCSMIGPLPQVSYDMTGMSEKQVEDLENDRYSTYNYSRATMRVNLQPVGMQGGIQLQQEPEILRMDDNPTHKVVIQSAFNGFKQQGEIAAQVLACITETSVMRDKLPPVEMLPQLPAGE